MKQIQLTNGKMALVDDEDYENINKHEWYAIKGRYTYYAVRTSKHIRMHSTILGINEEIDHKDGNGLNNQKDNLRRSSQQQNMCNRKKFINSTSKYKGVYWNKNLKKWQVQIRVMKKAIYLGLFENEIEAAKSYDNAAIIHFGEFAKLNFS